MRALNMQALTEAVKLRHPGVTIYGIGDEAHKQQSSDHNEDDTSGVRTPQTDADNIPEHRAIDVMIGSSMSFAQCEDLVSDLVTDAGSRDRLYNIIFNGTLWSKNNNWVAVPFSGDPHTDHAHIAGRVSQDDNTAGWPVVSNNAPTVPGDGSELKVDGQLGSHTISKWQQVMGTPVDGFISPKNSLLVKAVQTKLKDLIDGSLQVDGRLGPYTIRTIQRYLKSPVDGFISKPRSQMVMALQRRLNENRF